MAGGRWPVAGGRWPARGNDYSAVSRANREPHHTKCQRTKQIQQCRPKPKRITCAAISPFGSIWGLSLGELGRTGWTEDKRTWGQGDDKHEEPVMHQFLCNAATPNEQDDTKFWIKIEIRNDRFRRKTLVN